MKRMWTCFCAFTLAALCSGNALAGRNINGALVVHTNDSYDYSAGHACDAAQGDPGTCIGANTTATRATGQVVWLLAAFSEMSDPCVSVVYFGIDYDDASLDPGVAYTKCGPIGTIEIPDDDWPHGGRGNSVAFSSPICHDTLFPFYVFAMDGGIEGTSYFCTTDNPTGGYAAFVDDGDPPLLDYCYLFGCVRWGEPGANECPGYSQTPGACCYPDGTCAIVTAEECMAADGIYLGDNEPCIPDPCPDPGACCYADGHCEFVVPARCDGEFQPGSCSPNPCPQPGACCFQDGRCEYLGEHDCGTGDFHAGVACDPNPCPQPGACCFQDGSCFFTLPPGCHTGTFYPETPCDPNPCPQPIRGACCYQGGYCEYQAEYDCYTGDFRPNVPCDPNPCPQPIRGACCYMDGSCAYVADYECGTGDFRPDVPCDPNPCPQPGACCTVDFCIVTMEAQCEYTFHPGLSCDPNPCWPTGACCFPDGHCESLLQGYCTTGLFYPDVACEPNPCPPPVEGGCCFPDGHCEFRVVYECETGVFYPEVACDPNPCPQPVQGACCFPDGHCEQMLDYQCGTGVFYAEVACEPNPCPQPVLGACCFPDGHCEYIYDYQCQTGSFYAGTPCVPNPCPQPSFGACCYPDGHCEYVPQDQCGGAFYPNYTCDPNPCPTDCVHRGLIAGHGAPATSNLRSFSPRTAPAQMIPGSREVCWSEPPNLNGAKISSEIIADFGLESEIANDFMLAGDGTITRIIAYGGMYNWSGEPAMTHFNMYFYADQGCVPGVPFECYLSAQPSQTFIGYDGYGYPTYKLEYTASVNVMGGQLYWFGFQAANHPFPPQWGRQGAGEVTNCDTVFKSVFFSYPNWTPAGDLVGEPYDAAQEFECGSPTKVEKTTWGAIKARFR